MIARWGCYELLLRRRLRLLREINSHWNPRLGVDHVIGENLDRLCAFFRGSACVLVLNRPDSPHSHLMYSVAQTTSGQLMEPREISENSVRALALPEAVGVAYNGRAYHLPWLGSEAVGHDFRARMAVHLKPERCLAVQPARCGGLYHGAVYTAR